MRSSSPSIVAAALLLAASASACRSPEGTPEAPQPTSDRPFVTGTPLTDAEAARNERFEDMRRKRFQGGERLDASPREASSPSR